MVNRSYRKLAHAKGTQFERSMFHAERSILNWSTFALPRWKGRTWRLRHSVGHTLRNSPTDNYPSVVRTTTSTRRLGLCSSIEPFAEARNFVAPNPFA